jgi:hypothetical protein
MKELLLVREHIINIIADFLKITIEDGKNW